MKLTVWLIRNFLFQGLSYHPGDESHLFSSNPVPVNPNRQQGTNCYCMVFNKNNKWVMPYYKTYYVASLKND